jgi:type IV secretory pathway VirB10-like protein
LVARLQTAVSTAVKAPVVAVIETHYERDGEIVLPAGTKAFGELESGTRSGYVGIRFHTLQMPDGTTATIEAGAMSLNFGPLKGQVTAGTVAAVLARALTGVGTEAAFAVGIL